MNKTDGTKIAVIANNIEYIKRDVNEIKKTIKTEYVRKAEFEPVKKIVYGLVAIVLTAVVTAMVALVLK